MLLKSLRYTGVRIWYFFYIFIKETFSPDGLLKDFFVESLEDFLELFLRESLEIFLRDSLWIRLGIARSISKRKGFS